MIIIIKYKGKKKSLEIDVTDTIKKIMEKFFIQIDLNLSKRFYSKDKFIFTFNDILLNDDENSLNKTAEDIGLDDDDNLLLINTEDINPGIQNNFF